MEAEEALQDLVYGGELYRDDLNKVSFILKNYQGHLDSKALFLCSRQVLGEARASMLLFVIWESKRITKAHTIEVLL